MKKITALAFLIGIASVPAFAQTPPAPPKPDVTITFSQEEVQILWNALMEQKAGTVLGVAQKVRDAAIKAQSAPASSAPAIPPPS